MSRCAIAFDIGAFARHDHPRRGQVTGSGVRTDRTHLPRLDPLLDRRGPRKPGGQERRTLEPRPGKKNLAHSRVWRTGLNEDVVAVVPPGHQTKTVHRREHRRPRSDHAPHMSPKNLQPGGITGLRTLPGGQTDVPPCTQQGLEGPVNPVDIAMVRNHDQGTAPFGQ